MRKIKILMSILIVITLDNHLIAQVNPQPGENLWHILAAVGTEVDTLSSGLCDFSGSFTMLNAILAKDCTTLSKIDVLSTATGATTSFDQTFTIIQALALCNPTPFFGGTIANPGHYCLAVPLIGGTVNPLITISASDVLLDLNGHILSLVSTATAISINTSASNITIVNGFFEGGLSGVLTFSTNSYKNLRFENLEFNFPGTAFEIHQTSNILMHNCISFNSAQFGLSIGTEGNLSDISQSILIENCNFSNGAIGAKIVSANDLLLKCCSFNVNNGEGFQCENLNSVLFDTCSFNDNGIVDAVFGNGMRMRLSANVHFSNCSFDRTSASSQQPAGLLLFSPTMQTTIDILAENSSFNGNVQYGVSLSANGNISCNKFVQCSANGNGIDGYHLETMGMPAGTIKDIDFANCFACVNTAGSGFNVVNGSDICLVECTAKGNLVGFHLNANTGNSGLIKECVAVSNTKTGFEDDGSPATFSYVANSAKGNGTNPADTLVTGTDTNYYISPTMAASFISPGPGSTPFLELDLTSTLKGYWDNITMPF